jgi:hypothetical protein
MCCCAEWLGDVSGGHDRNRCSIVRSKRDQDVPDVGVVGEHFSQFASQHFGEIAVRRIVSDPTPSLS